MEAMTGGIVAKRAQPKFSRSTAVLHPAHDEGIAEHQAGPIRAANFDFTDRRARSGRRDLPDPVAADAEQHQDEEAVHAIVGAGSASGALRRIARSVPRALAPPRFWRDPVPYTIHDRRRFLQPPVAPPPPGLWRRSRVVKSIHQQRNIRGIVFEVTLHRDDDDGTAPARADVHSRPSNPRDTRSRHT